MSTPTAINSATHRAREQAHAYDSVFGPTDLPIGDGENIVVPPHPNLRMLDDPRQEEYEELLFEVANEYEREPDIYFPEQHLDNGKVLPAETKRGPLLEPYCRRNADGKLELVKPPHSVRIVQIALGPDDYARLRAAGKSSADVWRIWNEQAMDLADRQASDSKSDGSASLLAALSNANRV